MHAPPYSPENRGKMERAWRTMRQRCADHLPTIASLHEVDVALWSWLDADYHRRPHGGLMGSTPRKRYLAALARLRAPLTPKELAAALEISEERNVRKDGTLSWGGTIWEVSGRHLAGKTITVVVDGLTERPLRMTYQGQPVRFGVCDAVANRSRGRASAAEDRPEANTPFDPIAALLQKAREVGDE